MYHIKGYKIEKEISSGRYLKYCRAIRVCDGLPVLLRIPVDSTDTNRSLNMLEREFLFSGNIPLQGAVPVLALEKSINSTALVIEDRGWISLRSLFDEYHPDCVKLAIEMARSLALLHSSGIVHRNLHCDSFMFLNDEKLNCAIIGFENSIHINCPDEKYKPVPVAELVLAAASPEVLGLIPFLPDFRSDLYSLGVVLYEIITGIKPFPYRDHNDLIYAHIALEPVPPYALSGNIPAGLSDIIMKLLLKDPDSRYQSAAELLHELELYPDKSQLPYYSGISQTGIRHPLFTGRLYGRDNEMYECMKIFEEVRGGSSRIILVGGQPGAGKTSFVNRLMGRAVPAGGLYGYSKDNRHSNNIPYAGISGAFGHIIRQILSKSDADISFWKEKFIKALGPNVPVIADIIPEFELITGPHPRQADPGHIEARNKFIISFQRFVEVLTCGSSPLVIFLDDLQWADKTGLDLLKTLTLDSGLDNMLIIGAYRDNEMTDGDPLSVFLNGIKSNSEYAEFLNFKGISVEATIEMVEDTLHTIRGDCRELGDYIFRKTAGNPYYIREYLKTACSGGLLGKTGNGKWEWDIDVMDRLPATESLASVLNGAMRLLDEDMKNVLAAGACAGWAFSAQLIASVLRIPVSAVTVILDKLVMEGYIVPDDENYRFAHDRIRETAYDLIPEKERLILHRRTGRILFGMAEDDTEIFYAVEQINLAADIITDRKERTEIASLNLEAGIMSVNRTAFAPALAYIRTAIEFLPEHPWESEYKLTAKIMKELARCESVNGNLGDSEKIVEEALKHLRTDEEKAEFLTILVMQMNITGRFHEAVDLARHALSLLGLEIPGENIGNEIYAEMNFLGSFIDRNGIRSLTELSENNNSRSILIIKILLQLGWPSYFLDKQVVIYVSLKMMNLTIQYGLSRETIAACCCYVGMQSAIYKDYDIAYKFWKLTEEIMGKLNDRYYTAEICLKAANYILPMMQHLRDSEPVNAAGYNAGCMSGELLCSGYIAAHKAVNSFHYGKELGVILSDIAEQIIFILKTSNFIASDVMLELKKTVIYLTGNIEDVSFIESANDYEDETGLSERIKNNEVIFCQVQIFRLQAFFISGKYGKCFDIISTIKDRVENMSGLFTATEFVFYHSLTLTALIPDADEITGNSYREEIISNQKIMKGWADRCPENYMQKFFFVEAELARLDGRISDAMNFYDRGIASAKENKYIQNEALGNELAAKFWLSLGKDEFGEIYLRKARALYAEWGASHKVYILEHFYPWFFVNRKKSGNHENNDPDITNQESTAVVSSLQAISGEIELDKLLHTLTRIILQFEGATRLVLMIEKNGTICIEAEGSVTRSTGEIISELLPSVPVETCEEVPLGVIRYCCRTGNTVIVNDISSEEMFLDDPYITRTMPKSFICARNNYGSTNVIAYLENSLARYAFTSGKVEVLKLISVQAAISLENARLYNEKKESIKKLAELGHVRDRLLRQYDEAEQRSMQKRMDPHFIYNAVHTVHALININPDEADRAVILLGEMLHFFTDRSFEQLIRFNDEWRLMELYIEFEKIRFPDTLVFSIDRDDPFEGVLIPPLTIQPFVENAIKHGLRKKADGGYITIFAERKSDFIKIEITDTGQGINAKDIYSRSIGNILNRLRYNFVYADVTLENREQGGAKATVTFSTRRIVYE